MASAKFLEEALSTDVDESAVSAIVGSLENQLVTTTPTVVSNQSNQQSAGGGGGGGGVVGGAGVGGGGGVGVGVSVSTGGNNNAIVSVGTTNHVNSAISNGANGPQKHAVLANGETINITASVAQVPIQQQYEAPKEITPTSIVYSQAPQTMTSTGAIINRVAYPANGTINPGGPMNNANSTPKQQTLVIKTSSATPGGIVTVPMATVPQANNVGSPTTQSPAHHHHHNHPHNTILSNLQVVNVRPGMTPAAAAAAAAQQQQHLKAGQTARVVLSAPQLVGARPGTPQLTLQSLQGLQPGQQGHLLLKTENGQYQLLRVGPAPAAGAMAGATATGQPMTFRMQTMPAQAAVTTTAVNSVGNTIVQGAVSVATPIPVPTAAPITTTPTVQRPANDNTKEKCRKFLANLLELSSREPKTVERNVRVLIQDLIDAKVEPEDFCDRLERLLNASPQPCLIGFLKKSLPLLRHSLATKELTIEGIRPPLTNVVYSIANAPTVQTQLRPGLATSQVRLVTPGTTVVRPALVQHRLVTPVRGAVQQTRMVTTIRQPNVTQPVITNSQPPALHPVYPANQIRTGVNIVRQPVQVRTAPVQNQIRQPLTIRTTAPNIQVPPPIVTPIKNIVTTMKVQSKPVVPSNISKIAAAATKDKEKNKTFSSAYTGDDDINDVAAMGGVNLAEETQRILGSTEYIGTQIKSCKEEFFLNMTALQHRIRQVVAKHNMDEPTNEVAAIVSHAVQERLKNVVEKLAVITEHRLEMVKSDPRYEVTTDIKGQLKFLEELDRAERKRHEELEREMLMRAAKSRSKTEDPEQAKLKAKAKEMQRVEMEELRQREANATALQAIGPRKKPRLDGDGVAGASQTTPFPAGARGQLPLKQRMKKVTLRDLQFLFESEKDLCKSTLLYKSYLK